MVRQAVYRGCIWAWTFGKHSVGVCDAEPDIQIGQVRGDMCFRTRHSQELPDN